MKDSKIIKILEPYDYVSFDIFDTLILRDVPSPKDVFTIMGEVMAEQRGQRLPHFTSERISAEKKARKEKHPMEVSMEDIYERIDIPLGDKESVIELEKEVELKVAHKNTQMQDVYNWCLKHGKKIVLISDMYLPKECIEKMLSNCGYEGYSRLYLSCDCQKRKACKGELFDYALQDLNITPNKIVHIGDHPKSDGRNPGRLGIKSILVRPNIHTEFFRENSLNDKDRFHYHILRSFCANRDAGIEDYFERFGYEVFGPLLAGFCDWLNSQTLEKKAEKIYFFARDGYIVKKAYDILFPNTDIKDYYLEVSRRSLRVPQIWVTPDYEDIVGMFSPTSLQNIIVFFDNLGLSFYDYEEKCQAIGINADYTFKRNGMLGNSKLREVYGFIKEDVINNSKAEYAALLAYMNNYKLHGNIAVVDIGWRGSMQKFLLNVCRQAKIDVDILGLYVGLAKGARDYSKEKNINFKGYVFDCNSNERDQDLRAPFVGLFESLFLAQSGSCKRYFFDEKGKVKVELYRNEYLQDNGSFTEDANSISKIQNGALKFVEDYKNCVLRQLNISSQVFFANLYNAGVNPDKVLLKKFGDLDFRDGGVEKLASPEPLGKYFAKPRKLISDFYNSRWKVGFMKRLFKIPLPYSLIFSALKKI